MKDYEIFSKRLKKALYHNNRMTQHELSILTKISEVSISRYANGDRIPKGPEIAIMARVLNISTDYLLGLDDDMNGKEKGTIYVDEILKYCKEAAVFLCCAFIITHSASSMQDVMLHKDFCRILVKVHSASSTRQCYNIISA